MLYFCINNEKVKNDRSQYSKRPIPASHAQTPASAREISAGRYQSSSRAAFRPLSAVG